MLSFSVLVNMYIFLTKVSGLGLIIVEKQCLYRLKFMLVLQDIENYCVITFLYLGKETDSYVGLIPHISKFVDSLVIFSIYCILAFLDV